MYQVFSSIIRLPFVRLVNIKLSCQYISIQSCFQKNYYEALGVSQNATQGDIKAAYYKLSMIYHPDRNDSVEAAESFRSITEAYEVIGNFKLRKMYDRGLLGKARAGNDTRRSYSNYNPSSSMYRNNPMAYDKASTYNFDEWSRSHYGDTFNKRNQAKMRYEERVNVSSNLNRHNKHENVVYTICFVTFILFSLTYSIRGTLDDPSRSNRKQN